MSEAFACLVHFNSPLSDGFPSSVQKSFRNLGRRPSDFNAVIFQMIAKLVILLNGQIVFCRDDVMLRQPFGVDIDPPRAVVHRLTPQLPVLPCSRAS